MAIRYQIRAWTVRSIDSQSCPSLTKIFRSVWRVLAESTMVRRNWSWSKPVEGISRKWGAEVPQRNAQSLEGITVVRIAADGVTKVRRRPLMIVLILASSTPEGGEPGWSAVLR